MTQGRLKGADLPPKRTTVRRRERTGHKTNFGNGEKTKARNPSMGRERIRKGTLQRIEKKEKRSSTTGKTLIEMIGRTSVGEIFFGEDQILQQTLHTKMEEGSGDERQPKGE